MQSTFTKVTVALAVVRSASALGIIDFYLNNTDCTRNEIESNTGAGCQNIDLGFTFDSFFVGDQSAAMVEVQLFSDTSCQVSCQNFTVPSNSPCHVITDCGAGARSFIGTEL
ncbi:hypothetical protein GQ53DRAFT_828300 [Thozetella sp. PMI_491]|nr:hypothetical protein GQ53DRAFT_828300 [Thozetella sp. PMI_491]